MLGFEQCKVKAEKEYKEFKVLFGFEYKGNYCFGLVPKRVPKDETPLIDFHIVDSESGEVSGFYSINELIEDPEFERQLNKVFSKSDVIEHHGIKGQKWGVKNGPPYPLDDKTHDEVVEKGVDPELAAVGIEVAATIAVAATAAIANAIKTRRKHKQLTERIHLDSEELQKRNIADLTKFFSDDNPPRKIKGEHSEADDMAKVNPLYNEKVQGSDNNCLLCSMTYDLRRRGYDVTALLTSEGMFGRRTEKECYKKSKSEAYQNCSDYKQVEKQMLKNYPEGSRGILHLAYFSYMYGSFGHACNWEIKNGKLVIIDAQRNIKGSISEKKMTSIFMPGMTSSCRTDNLEINWEKMNNICAEVLDKEAKHSDDFTWKRVTGMASIGEILVTDLDRDYLEHHGIKGMKWGIRRFQNYDGTYTKKGLARYEYDEKRYHEAKSSRDAAKAAYKSGTGTKGEYQNAKIKLKAAKRQLSNAYDQVKKDKRADEGKKLYEKGQRITSNTIAENWKQIGVAFIGNMLAKNLHASGKTKQAAALCAAGNTFLAASYVRTKIKNKKIAAFYSHSRPDSLKMPKGG